MGREPGPVAECFVVHAASGGIGYVQRNDTLIRYDMMGRPDTVGGEKRDAPLDFRRPSKRCDDVNKIRP